MAIHDGPMDDENGQPITVYRITDFAVSALKVDDEEDAYVEGLCSGSAYEAEMRSLRTAEDDGPLLDADPTDPDVQAWMEGDELRWR